MQPVSIVVTVLNEAEDIGRVVTSLLAQRPPAAEVIVVDGGSSDGTWEWLKKAEAEAQALGRRLVAIRDETCNLKHCAGPISRGRNVAIAAAKSEIIACADAGCSYAADWLANLTAEIAAGRAEYALGGSCIDPDGASLWDIASAPFFSIKLSPTEPTKSCTARSMAFTRVLWERVGRFPESVLLGEDTLFDAEARRQTQPAFISNAKALYCPRNSFRSAAQQMARYAVADGQSRIRQARLFRNAARCMLELAALASLRWTYVPLLVIFAIECWYAFHRDGKFLVRLGARAVLARLAFSVAVPWVVAVNQIRGRFSARPLSNRQNVQSARR